MKAIDLAPVCLFTYNRLIETIKTVEALQLNYLAPQSEIFIFSDGAKDINNTEKVEAVREYIRTISGFKTIVIHEYSNNKGLANSIISGINQIIKKYGKVIVLEDDLITAPNFLNFMNQALDFYESNEKIFSISGYTLNLASLKNYSKDYYLGYRASSWGWATWQNRWLNVDWDIKDYNRFKLNPFKQIKFMRGGIDMPFMLYNQMNKRIDSWAIRWCYNQFKFDMLTVFPSKSKLVSIGFGEEATNTKKGHRFVTTLDEGMKANFIFAHRLVLDLKLIIEFRRRFSFLYKILDNL